MTDNRRHDAHRRLRVYLQDHFAGATAGLALAQRCRKSNPDLDELLGDIERQIAEDRGRLKSIMARLGVRPSRVKSAFGAAAELVARLKSNGRWMHYSPSSRVVELEALAAGIATKRNLWHSLVAIANERAALDRAELDELIEKATAQFERVVAEHHRSAATGFSQAGAAQAADDPS